MQDARVITVLGIEVYLYGLFVALGALAFILLLAIKTRRDEKAFLAAGYTALLALIFGFVLSRLMFVFFQPDFAPLISFKNILDVRSGGFAMYGALAGAVLAALLGARLAKTSKASMLDHLALAIPAFLVFARLGEGFTALGISRPLTTPFISASFLAFVDEYDAYLRTYLLEATIALVMLFTLLRFSQKNRRRGLVFAAFCLFYGISQTLMESLRYDGHLRFSFVGVQQVLSAVLFALTLIALSIRLLKQSKTKKALPLIALISLPFILLAIIGIEFLIDRSQLGKLFSYALYILALALPAALGILMLRQEAQLGQSID